MKFKINVSIDGRCHEYDIEAPDAWIAYQAASRCALRDNPTAASIDVLALGWDITPEGETA